MNFQGAKPISGMGSLSYIVKNIYGYPYEFEFTGMTKGKVPPENIISIEEIKGYIQMQEKYPDYVEFYNEIE